MSRIASLVILVVSPLVLSAGLAFGGSFLHAVGRAFGSQRPPTAIVVATLFAALLHVGYYLGPLLWIVRRPTLALWLMVPVALVGGVALLGILLRILPAATESGSNVRWFHRSLACGLAIAAAYLAPIVVMARESPR